MQKGVQTAPTMAVLESLGAGWELAADPRSGLLTTGAPVLG